MKITVIIICFTLMGGSLSFVYIPGVSEGDYIDDQIESSGPFVLNIDTGENFTSIQAAIDDSDTLNGHTITIANGTYNENVYVNKALTLIGEDKNTTFINGNYVGDVVQVAVDWVNISSLTIMNSGLNTGDAAVELFHTHNCTIYNNILVNNSMGVYVIDQDNLIQVTSNSIGDRDPEIGDNGDMCWLIDDGNDYEVGYWNGATIMQLTNNALDDVPTDINDNGEICWFGGDNNIFEIYYSDTVTTVQLTNNAYDDRSPYINNDGGVCWYGGSTNKEIYYWDGTSTTQVSSNPNGDYYPRINNNAEICWQAYNGISSEIYYWDGASTTQITNDAYLDQSAKINDNGDVIWVKNMSIYYWDGNSTTKIADNTQFNFGRPLNDNGEICWHASDGHDYEIYYWDGFTTTQITDNSYDDFQPQINNNGEICWQGRAGDDEIFYWDGTDIWQITYNSYQDRLPKMNNEGEICWYMNDGHDDEIYFWDGNTINSQNYIMSNEIRDNSVGIKLESTYKNHIYSNFIIDNIVQAIDDRTKNYWDNGYPSGGNYWSDYDGINLFSGINQDIPGPDSFGDTPYTDIQGGTGALDNYPLWPSQAPQDVYPIYGFTQQYDGTSGGGYNPVPIGGCTVAVTWGNTMTGTKTTITTVSDGVTGFYSVDISNYTDGGVVYVNVTGNPVYGNRGYNWTIINSSLLPGGCNLDIVCGIPYSITINQPVKWSQVTAEVPFNIEYTILDRNGVRSPGYFTFGDGAINISAGDFLAGYDEYSSPPDRIFNGISSPDPGHLIDTMTLGHSYRQWYVNVSEGGKMETNPYLTPWGEFYIDPALHIPGFQKDWYNTSVNVISPWLVHLGKTAPTAAEQGETITYALDYQCIGTSNVQNVVITENYPLGITFVNANPVPTVGNNIWNIGTLSPGQSGTIFINVTISPTVIGTLTNHAELIFENDKGVTQPVVNAWANTGIKLITNINTGEKFVTIQSANDDPDTLSGHTLYVPNGSYYGASIDKSITIMGESRNGVFVGNSLNPYFVYTSFFTETNFITIHIQDLTMSSMNIGDDGMAPWLDSTSFIVNNCQINSGIGINQCGGTGTISCYNSYISGSVGCHGGGLSFTQCTIAGTASSLHGNFHSYNSSFTAYPYHDTVETIDVRSQYRLRVVNTLGQPIQGASVQIKDNANGSYFNVLNTDSNGYIAPIDLQILLQRWGMQNFAYFTPYNITISKSGYLTKAFDLYHVNHLFLWDEVVLDIPKPLMEVIKSAPATAIPGETITYWLNYTNLGQELAQNIQISESYPTNLSFDSAIPAPSIGNNIWYVGTLAPGASGSIEITATIGADYQGFMTNFVSLDYKNTMGIAQPTEYANATTHVFYTGYLNITLVEGWNLISLPFVQFDGSIDNVLASIEGKWNVVKYYDSLDLADPWKSYRIGGTANDLAEIDNTMGFWIFITQPNVTLTVTGMIPSTTTIPLYAGWNLVGYPAQTTNTIGNALWGTGADRVEVFDPVSPYIKEVGPTYVMKPGGGYWVHVPVDTIWVITW